MSLQEYYWIADYHYVQARKQDSRYVSEEEWDNVRAIHRAKKAGG